MWPEWRKQKEERQKIESTKSGPCLVIRVMVLFWCLGKPLGSKQGIDMI